MTLPGLEPVTLKFKTTVKTSQVISTAKIKVVRYIVKTCVLSAVLLVHPTDSQRFYRYSTAHQNSMKF